MKNNPEKVKVNPRTLIKNKVKSEFDEIKRIWYPLMRNWKTENEDYEDLYRVRIPLAGIAFWCRYAMKDEYLYSSQTKSKNSYSNIKVRILIDKNNGETFYKNVNSMEYSDSFQKMGESFEELNEICNFIIHESESVFADDMISYHGDKRIRKTVSETSFYYCVQTFHLRKRLNKNKTISYSTRLSDENSGEVFIDIDCFLRAVEDFIQKYE